MKQKLQKTEAHRNFVDVDLFPPSEPETSSSSGSYTSESVKETIHGKGKGRSKGKNQKQCLDFRDKGTCRFGDTCKFAHVNF